jgi:hypothetical protein
MMGFLELGAVVAVYPQGTSVDVVLNDGGRLANVQVMVGSGSDATGHVDLTDVGGPLDDNRWILTMPFDRYVRAVISYIGNHPICIGFLLPQVSQMTFNRKNFRVTRHASDSYSTVSDTGDMETYHPSGTYFRVGASPAHEDLTSQDFDSAWKIARNTAAAPWVNLTVCNAGSPVATLSIDPSGNVSLTHKGNLTVNTQGNADVTVEGTTNVTSDGAATLKAPSVTVDSAQSTFTGAVTVQGAFVFESGMTGQAGESGGNTMTITGDAHYTGTVTADTDVIAGNISGKGHEHESTAPGSPTSPPIAGT